MSENPSSEDPMGNIQKEVADEMKKALFNSAHVQVLGQSVMASMLMSKTTNLIVSLNDLPVPFRMFFSVDPNAIEATEDLLNSSVDLTDQQLSEMQAEVLRWSADLLTKAANESASDSEEG